MKGDRKRKFPLIVNSRPAGMNTWQDCQWLREPCKKAKCPICGRIRQDREMHIAKGEDPDSPESLIADLSSNFREMLDLLHKDITKNKSNKESEAPDEEIRMRMPIDYPIYNKVMEWRQGIYDIAEDSDETSEAWLYTDAGKDLMWYSSTLLVKIFRQFNTLDELDNDELGSIEIEYNYTGYVLFRVINILDKALEELSQNKGAHAAKFNIARLSFVGIKEEIINFV